ncbi:MAG: hypothetical protein HY727_15060 [Candidatus Rokubacteria bacterium]|nr:hypothetical protein [Candidatus Rokubacteria bacterium]
MEAVIHNRILSAAALGFPNPEEPPRHTPTFGRPGLTPGRAWCPGCEQEITRDQWLMGICHGKDAA